MNPGRLGPVVRLLFRAPTRLYDRGLGWLLGKRFLCLTHVGRKSRRRYRTVLEVIGTDPASGEVMVIAGMGLSSDWYRNIQANPAVEVVIGRRRFAPTHRAERDRSGHGGGGVRTAQPLGPPDHPSSAEQAAWLALRRQHVRACPSGTPASDRGLPPAS